MEKVKKIIINKKGTKALTYWKPENKNYYELKPNSNFHSDEMIRVHHMFVVDTSLIKNIIDKKCQRSLEKILKLLAIIYEDDDTEDDTILKLALDQIEKFRITIDNEYKEHMDDKDYKLMLKKLEILDSELSLRLETLAIYKATNKVNKKQAKPKPVKSVKLETKAEEVEDNPTGGVITSIGTIEEAKQREENIKIKNNKNNKKNKRK